MSANGNWQFLPITNVNEPGGRGGKSLRPSPPEPTGKDAHLMSLPRGGGIGVEVPKEGLRYGKF